MAADLSIREVDGAWPIFHAVIAAGDTYSYPPDLELAQARALWLTPPSRCFIAERDGEILGLYMLRPNQPGLGDHVANAGYMVASSARGQGIASAMCEHSMEQARHAGFDAMQFTTSLRATWARYACGSDTASRSSARFRMLSGTRSTARLTST
jgi:GNAT superfamily N-acetyltransferase